MGGAVSTGEDNDDLINNLVEADCIKSSNVERAFRAVDRADYYVAAHRDTAYKDVAWKHGNLHLSAPCIYSEVMEALKLEPGLSFLNIGSGTGYLSTITGLILGPYGINHGIELHSEVVDYAREVLEEFKRKSSAIDQYEFCEPQYRCGNCLLFDMDMILYDRVYCGAGCPVEQEQYMKNLIKVGGLLVMPLKDYLLQVTRTGKNMWEVKKLLSVTFASLVPPSPDYEKQIPEQFVRVPPKLTEICRSVIRVILRNNIEREYPSLKNKQKKRTRKTKKCKMHKFVIPIFHDSDNESSHEDGARLHRDISARIGHNEQPRTHQVLNFSVLSPSDTTEYEAGDESSFSNERSAEESSSASFTAHSVIPEILEDSPTCNERLEADLQMQNIDYEPSSSSDRPSRMDSETSTCSSGTDFGAADVSSMSGSSQAGTSRRLFRARRTNSVLWKRLANEDVETDSDDTAEKLACKECPPLPDISTPTAEPSESYAKFMHLRIARLPLPDSIQLFINYDRPFK